MAQQQYQVAYEGQIITEPLDFETACSVAAGENADALVQGYMPLAEVVVAPAPEGS